MQTANRRKVDLLKPDPDAVDVRDIAVALSKICRYNGHTATHYSVAEHCCLVSDHLRRTHSHDLTFAAAGLLHDASEAYVGDLTSPMQLALGDEGRKAVKAMHHRMWLAIVTKLRIPESIDIEHPEVKAVDRRICHDECRDMLGGPVAPWGIDGGALGIPVRGWIARRAEIEWLDRFVEFFPGRLVKG